mmetsp:Transcript_803/g.2349  ORF Transcript_803/g.2349 Transcript_803/m.2349 type:complete len:200 (-) Transcript_803:1283-1882(-)
MAHSGEQNRGQTVLTVASSHATARKISGQFGGKSSGTKQGVGLLVGGAVGAHDSNMTKGAGQLPSRVRPSSETKSKTLMCPNWSSTLSGCEHDVWKRTQLSPPFSIHCALKDASSSDSFLRAPATSYSVNCTSLGNRLLPKALAGMVMVSPTAMLLYTATTLPSLSATSMSTTLPCGVPHPVSSQLIPPLVQWLSEAPR